MSIKSIMPNTNNIEQTQSVGNPVAAFVNAWHSVEFIKDEVARTNQFKKELRRLANSGKFSREDSAYFNFFSFEITRIHFNKQGACLMKKEVPWFPLDPIDIHFSDGSHAIMFI